MRQNPSSHGITRRDFVNGVLMSAGAAALSGVFPGRALTHSEIGSGLGDGGIGSDPRALRGGDLPSTFNIGHWLRDERLTFKSNGVRVAPADYDSYQGHFDIVSDTGGYDVIVVGSGLSGLATAFYIERRRPGARVLLLDASPSFGGNAGRDDAPPIPTIASTAGAYAVAPYADFLTEVYDTVGVDWETRIIPAPLYCYFFDDRTPYVLLGTRGWTLDVYGAGVADMPYPTHILNDLKKARQDFRNWYNREGAPTDPADNSDPRFDGLAVTTLDDYLTRDLRLHPAVSDFYTRYAVDALAGTSKQACAYTSISFLGAEYNPLFTYPGGTSGLARHVLKWLIPGAIEGSTSDEIIADPLRVEALDRPGQPVRVRQRATALRADTGPTGASVVYFMGGRFWRAQARAVVLAGQSHSAHRIVEHLLTPQALGAWQDLTLSACLTANVTLRRAAPLVDLGLGYDQYYWGSRTWADFVVADWVTPQRFNRERPTVLTFYGASERPPEEMARERVKLLTTPFAEYEQSLREDLNRVLAGAGFDFDRDVSAIYVYRWGHSMVYPKLGYVFGAPTGAGGQVQRTFAPRHAARAPLGRISFAGQDLEGSPAVESAMGSGLRVALEALAHL